jgi:hypothetical protein
MLYKKTCLATGPVEKLTIGNLASVSLAAVVVVDHATINICTYGNIGYGYCTKISRPIL